MCIFKKLWGKYLENTKVRWIDMCEKKKLRHAPVCSDSDLAISEWKWNFNHAQSESNMATCYDCHMSQHHILHCGWKRFFSPSGICKQHDFQWHQRWYDMSRLWMKVIRQRLAFQIPLCQGRGRLFQTRVGEIAWSASSSPAATQILVNQMSTNPGSDQLHSTFQSIIGAPTNAQPSSSLI